MNDLLYNRRTAYIAVLLMVLVSIFILGGNDLQRERTRVVDVLRGQNELGIDVESEAALIRANSANLLVVAGRYLDSESGYIINIQHILDNTDTGSNFENWEIMLELVNNVLPYVNELLHVMDNIDVEIRDAEHLTEIEGNIHAALRRIHLSGYEPLANRFNRQLRNPYTSLIATVRGIREFLILN